MWSQLTFTFSLLSCFTFVGSLRVQIFCWFTVHRSKVLPPNNNIVSPYTLYVSLNMLNTITHMQPVAWPFFFFFWQNSRSPKDTEIQRFLEAAGALGWMFLYTHVHYRVLHWWRCVLFNWFNVIFGKYIIACTSSGQGLDLICLFHFITNIFYTSNYSLNKSSHSLSKFFHR